METKKAKEWIDDGFGFPIRLRDVTLVKLRGEWTPKIDYNKLRDWALLSLCRLARPLSGHEVRFVRHSFEMTLQQFAKRFGVSHQAVMKWEKSGSAPTAMNWATEKDLRMAVQAKLSPSREKLGELYDELLHTPDELKVIRKAGLGPVSVKGLERELEKGTV